ncbi:histone H2A-like [Carcharodon carcharias]|uniref:histone H2A-like n=1 Tax=Carcharodon carcharias TaxID=13397 RepID=UPI001B7DB400|nr:histone H2A-like [Carcharodon carcharias]
MSGWGNDGGKALAKDKCRSARDSLHFPAGRALRFLCKGNSAERVGAGAPVNLAAVLEYLTAEIRGLAGNAAIGTTRRASSSPDTCSCPSATIRNSTSCWEVSPSLRAWEGGGGLPPIQARLLSRKKQRCELQEQVKWTKFHLINPKRPFSDPPTICVKRRVTV